MHIDQRLQTVRNWPAAHDPATAMRACLQIVGILSVTDASLLHGKDRFTALRYLVDSRRLLNDEGRRRLLSYARARGLHERAKRFLYPARAVARPLTGPFAAPVEAHRAALKETVAPPVVVRPKPRAAGSMDTPALSEAASNIAELIRRLDNFHPHDGAGPAKDEMLEQEAPWTSDRHGFIREGARAFGDGARHHLLHLLHEKPEEIARLLKRRAPFRNLPFRRRGAGTSLISGNPRFDAETGAFLGYRGRVHGVRERAIMGIATDTMADVAHEVRTPLNAILGYAEMIEQEVLGPAPATHRAGAYAIISDARRLLAAVDALGDAAALDTGQAVGGAFAITAQELMTRLKKDFAITARDRDIRLVFEMADDAPVLHAEPTALVRAVSRLLTAIMAFMPQGGSIIISARADCLSIVKPAALVDISEHMLMSGRIATPETVDAPLLGFAFTLRILKRLATANGGSFSATATAFELRLPAPDGEFEAEAS